MTTASVCEFFTLGKPYRRSSLTVILQANLTLVYLQSWCLCKKSHPLPCSSVAVLFLVRVHTRVFCDTQRLFAGCHFRNGKSFIVGDGGEKFGFRCFSSPQKNCSAGLLEDPGWWEKSNWICTNLGYKDTDFDARILTCTICCSLSSMSIS